MIASGPPVGAALAAPVSTTTLAANMADTARIRSEVDMVVFFRLDAQIARNMIAKPVVAVRSNFRSLLWSGC
jgi:hypothetical protein